MLCRQDQKGYRRVPESKELYFHVLRTDTRVMEELVLKIYTEISLLSTDIMFVAVHGRDRSYFGDFH